MLDLRVDKNGQRRGGKHVVARVVPGIGNLRCRDLYAAIREATIALARRETEKGGGARIVHLSIQRDHLHLLVEAHDKAALARGMQSFLISAARQINRACGRHGAVFGDRYHATILTTARHVRACLAVVLNNWRHHDQDRGRTWMIDPFSSGISFGGWKELEGSATMFRPPATYVGLFVWLPRTWLLATGWRMHGAVGAYERPG